MQIRYILVALAIGPFWDSTLIGDSPPTLDRSTGRAERLRADGPKPPYDVYRRFESPMPYTPLQLLPHPGTGMKIDFASLPERTDKLPYVVRLCWGTSVRASSPGSSFACVWSDGTVTNVMPRTEPIPSLYDAYNPNYADDRRNELRYILKPQSQTGG